MDPLEDKFHHNIGCSTFEDQVTAADRGKEVIVKSEKPCPNSSLVIPIDDENKIIHQDESEKGGREIDHGAADAGLNSLRKGIETITKHARSTLASCSTEGDWKDMTQRLEEASLRLIRAERCFLQTGNIISGIVDDVVSEEMIEDDSIDDEIRPLSITDLIHAGNDRVRLKMSQMYDQRVKEFENLLTNDVLEEDPNFQALKDQIGLANGDKRDRGKDELFYASGDSISPLDSEDDDEYDESVLPSMDPLSQQDIVNPIRNKLCNHVFEFESVQNGINLGSEITCPIIGCRNETVFKMTDFVRDEILEKQLRKMREANKPKSHF